MRNENLLKSTRNFWLPAILALSFWAGTPNIGHTQTLDQSNPLANLLGGLEITAPNIYSQTFTVGVAGILHSVKVKRVRNFSSLGLVAPLNLEIRTTSLGGVPDLSPAGLLASKTFPITFFPAFPNQVTLDFDLQSFGITVTSGDVLAFTLWTAANDPAFNAYAIDMEIDFPPTFLGGYPGGCFFTNFGCSKRDADFETFVLDDTTPPTANAGPDQAIRAGDTVNLDGSLSFDDNTASVDLDYLWSFTSKPGDSTTMLSGADTDMPSFTADVAGTYIVQLIVTDEAGLPSAPNQVEISSDNLAPTAAAGDDQLVIIDTIVGLDGIASSDPELDDLTFVWSITSKPTGSTAALSGADTDMPSFTPDLEGVYAIELVVSDPIGPSAPDTVVVTATAAEAFAEIKIVSASEDIADLPLGSVTTAGNQNAYGNFFIQAMVAIQEGDIEMAIDKLEKSLLRTDGCALRGEVDGNGKGRDWITNCDDQGVVYPILIEALDALTP